jgi:putative CocE/NonD family hydrolase
MRIIFLLLFLACQPGHAAEPAQAVPDMPSVARAAIASFKDDNPQRHLNTLFRLQLVAQDYAGAKASIAQLRQQMLASDAGAAQAYVQYEMFATAKQLEQSEKIAFDAAFSRAFRDTFSRLDDLAALRVASSLVFDLERARADLQQQIDKRGDDVALIRAFQVHDVFSAILPLTDTLLAEDDARRYLIDNDVLIKTADGATLSAVVARKRSLETPQPAALFVTIYANLANARTEAKLAAARGYVGVVSDVRGKRLSPDVIDPYEHDAHDVNGVIEWITRQPWSDGRVGMYGGSYSGFAQWAAAKHLHPALKTIVPYAAVIPGQGLPMENNVFINANYGWAFYVTNNKYLDDKTYFDRARWTGLNERWFKSGRSYRDIDKVDGAPNRMLQRWLEHPSYDSYWQRMVPYRQDYAHINIPVLSITGYYDDAQISAIHYLNEHYRFNPKANHFLVIGPYDHFGCQASRKSALVNEYAIDPVAHFDTPELTFQWFDHILRGAAKPAMLKDRINYQVMGANTWRHAPSLATMSERRLTLYLSDAQAGEHRELATARPRQRGMLTQTVDLADRQSSSNDYYPYPAIGKTLDPKMGMSFISQPFDAPVSVNGNLAGVLKATINKRDMDFGVVLYEVMPDGRLFQLSYFLGRASYARDMSRRQLLTPGKTATLPFERTRLVSRQLSKGSRLLVVLAVNKNENAQVNHGTGGKVADETVADAGAPLKVQWHNDSYVTVPLSYN